jgi:hypothetical protein
MLALLRVFWDIVCLRRGPRDLPSSQSLVLALGAAYLGAGILEAALFIGPSVALTHALVDAGCLVVVFTLLLATRGRAHRVPQTLSALFGAGLVLTPPDALVAVLFQAAHDAPSFVLIAYVSQILLILWNIAVIGHIVRQAIDVSRLAGVAVGTTYIVLEILIAEQLPRAAGA